MCPRNQERLAPVVAGLQLSVKGGSLRPDYRCHWFGFDCCLSGVVGRVVINGIEAAVSCVCACVDIFRTQPRVSQP